MSFDIDTYPNFTEGDYLLRDLQVVSRIREDDVDKFNNLPNVLVEGRKVTRTPSASNDVVATDREGDISFTATYGYVLIDNSGLTWRRFALGSW